MDLKNKKAYEFGHETVIWMYRLVLIALVLGAYVLIVYKNYSIVYDVRQTEASLISSKISKCLADNGVVSAKDIASEKIKNCLGVEKEPDNIYIKATLTYSNTSKAGIGNPVLGSLCYSKGKDVPVCSENKYYVLANNKEVLERASLNLLVSISKQTKD